MGKCEEYKFHSCEYYSMSVTDCHKNNLCLLEEHILAPANEATIRFKC